MAVAAGDADGPAAAGVAVDSPVAALAPKTRSGVHAPPSGGASASSTNAPAPPSAGGTHPPAGGGGDCHSTAARRGHKRQERCSEPRV